MAQSCPISSRKVNSNLVRIYSIQVSLLVLALILTKLPIFAFILLYDFSIRALRLPKLSPVHLIGKFIIGIFKIKPKMTDEAPKRFALYIGLSFSLALSLLYANRYYDVATITATILLICALLEAVFNYCLGCKIYQIIQSFK